MRRRWYTLSFVTIVAVSLVSSIYWRSLHEEVKNGFDRIIAVDKIQKIRTVSLNSENHYFAGWIEDALYLGNEKIPSQLFAISDNAKDTINIVNPISARIRNSRITIDSPRFQLADLDRFNIYRGQVDSWIITERVHSGQLFSEELLIGCNSIILRDLNNQKTQYVLSKETFIPYSRVTEESLIEKQIDGVFCTDGMLRLDRLNALVTYIYFYRNQFLVADTSLNLRLRARTIDTVSRANIKVALLSSERYRTIASPPKVVNRASFADDGKFYVNSNLMADNEKREIHLKSDVIDIYDLFSGKYEYSFYIARENGKRLRRFFVRKNRLYVLSGNRLVVYTLA